MAEQEFISEINGTPERVTVIAFRPEERAAIVRVISGPLSGRVVRVTHLEHDPELLPVGAD